MTKNEMSAYLLAMTTRHASALAAITSVGTQIQTLIDLLQQAEADFLQARSLMDAFQQDLEPLGYDPAFTE